MTHGDGYVCQACGEWHAELPFSIHAQAPDAWFADRADDDSSVLGEEQCIIKRESFFVRGLIRVPVADADEDFEWGVWISVSEANFDRMTDMWETDGREAEPAVTGAIANALPTYPQTTLGLAAQIHTQPVGLRPLIEIAPSEHLLAIEQRDGINRKRVQEIDAQLRHGT